MVYCNLCSTKVSYHGCTTNGISHLLKMHNLGRVPDANQVGIKDAMSKVASKLNSSKQHQISLSLGKMIVMDLLSYNIVNRPGFNALMATIEPRFKVPSDSHIANKVIPELYQLERVSMY